MAECGACSIVTPERAYARTRPPMVARALLLVPHRVCYFRQYKRSFGRFLLMKFRDMEVIATNNGNRTMLKCLSYRHAEKVSPEISLICDEIYGDMGYAAI